MRTLTRLTLITVLTLLFVLCADPVRAENPEGPVNPYAAEVYAHSQIYSQVSETATVSSMKSLLKSVRLMGTDSAAAALSETTVTNDFDFIRDVIPGYNQGGQWHVQANIEGNWKYEFFFGEYESAYFGNSWVIHKQSKSSNASYTSCNIAVPGKYRVLVNIYDGDTGLPVINPATNKPLQKSFSYNAQETPDHPAIETIAAGIVDACRGSTDYETALNLYDWITHNMYYDYDYNYYGADGALIRGYGVCDSYSKGYYLLLLSAGIPVNRISSENHAWNTLYLNGCWYQADPTWDDSAAVLRPVSGREGHEYFCITDELMLQSGHSYVPSDSTPCNSLDMNYYVMTPGSWNAWSRTNFTQVEEPVIAGANSYAVHAASESKRHLSILAWIFSTQPEWTADRRGEATWKYFFNVDNSALALAVMDGREAEGVWLYEPGEETAALAGYLGLDGSLVVPDELGEMPVTSVTDGAFAGDSRLYDVALPDGLTAIGADAFKRCLNLEEVAIPQSLLSIGARAFDGDVNLHMLELPDTVSFIGEEALPEDMIPTCSEDTPLAHALSEAFIGFRDASDPRWMLIWLSDAETDELAVLAAPTDDVIVEIPEKIYAVLSLGEAEPTALTVPETFGWFSDELTLPESLRCVITASGMEDVCDWAEAHSIAALLTDRQTALPASLTALEEEALSGVPMHWVILPAGITGIEADALACQGLAAVTFTGGEPVFSANSFGTNSPILLFPAGSAAAQAARDLGFTVLEQ